MKYTLVRPCAKCPFRTDFGPYLRPERAEEIADALEDGSTFACHETTVLVSDDDGMEEMTDGPGSQMCAGALIVLERMERPNQIMRVAERLGLYDRTRLDMDAPVYESLDDWIAAHY